MIVVTITEEDWATSIYSTYEWEKSVVIVQYEHDFIKKTYTIKYKDIDG